MDQKIVKIEKLLHIVRSMRKNGKKIVLAHGAFDLFHHGHLHYLHEAKKLGDILVVSVVSDHFVRKGLAKPVFDESVRARSIASFIPVDYVVMCRDFGPWEIIKKLRPHIYAKGEDSITQLQNKNSGVSADKRAIEAVGGRIIFTKALPIYSINSLYRDSGGSPDTRGAFLDDFRKRHAAPDILIELEKLKAMNVIVIGETIVDDYRYVVPLGRPSKSHVIAAHYQKTEEFAGGAAACANHLAALCGAVELVTVLSEKKSKKNLLLRQLKPNVRTTVFYSPEKKTTIKRRFLTEDLSAKLFEEYEFDKNPISEMLADRIGDYLSKKMKKADLVVVADYGHGLLLPSLIRRICRGAKFLAITAQTNSGNAGFNYVTKYPRADYVAVDELEARLAIQDDLIPVEQVLGKLYERMKPRQLVVTRGAKGILGRDSRGNIVIIPSFADAVVDAVGSGDAFLCVSASCAAAGFDIERASFIGSVAAAVATSIIGNRRPVEREELFRHIGYLLE